MKLCDYCIKNILQSEKYWDYHHPIYTSLTACHEWTTEVPEGTNESEVKKARCLFCATLKDDIDSIAPHLRTKENTSVWPVYRWNIRSMSKIRESPETVVVTFRYVPAKGMEGKCDTNEVILPTRTFLFFPKKDLQPLPSISQIGNSTKPAQNGSHQIQSWIKLCDTTHVDCMKRRNATPKADHFVPTRLLDISGHSEAPMKLIETTSTSVQSPYCTLSHCWGIKPIHKLKQGNMKHFMNEGVEWQLLSNNFKEAIQIVRSLDVGYIWIDSLCIVQEGDGGADWKHEAARMHSVYRNSYCNIAIADSSDSTHGAFRKRDPEDIVPVSYLPTDNSPLFRRKSWVVVPENLWDRELLQSHLYTRGWVFQERMLSPRILHFAKKQIFWDCPLLSACETLPAGLPQPMDSAAGPDRHWRSRLQESEDSQEPLVGANDQSMGAFWKTAVQKYTSCDLTKGVDKLIAMWGIAKLVRDAVDVEYGKGLFEENLEDQLAWRVENCHMKERPSESKVDKLARDIPSWSWASMDGTILVPDRLSDELHYQVTNHEGGPLTFDLVGVKRVFQQKPSRADAPLAPVRGISDSGLEMMRRDKEREPGNEDDIRRAKTFHRSDSPEQIDRNEEPKFHSTSIRIQGHVGYGKLQHNKLRSGWTLQLNGIPNGTIEAFPDLVPNLNDPVDASPYFIVLAAKQVIKPPVFTISSNDEKTENPFSPVIRENKKGTEEDVEYVGHGILMKRRAGNGVEDHHFQRTGAFRFRSASERTFSSLQETISWEELPLKLYNKKQGRKIWLD
ncbi:heterokaryon incompatibility protein-domain-containing protein [Phaeosphaeriaceae sp. PMI808]|nr:heterokaryon incompatibility protein-domain-containing protein [Phaeosphaeriaceae sp. PMI808]